MLPSGQSADSANDLSLLLKALKAEGEKRRKNAVAIRQIIVGIVSMYIVTTVILFIIKGKVEFSSVASMFTLFALAASGVAVSQSHTRALKEASCWKDPRLVPHLLEVLDANDEEIKSEAKKGLHVLLPSITEAKAFEFTSHQLDALAKLTQLGPAHKSDDLLLAAKAVSALGKVGRVESLAVLDTLADSSDLTKKAGNFEASLLQARADLRLRLAREIVESRSRPSNPIEKDLNS